MSIQYILAVAFSKISEPTDPDSLHLDMQYGFAQQSGGAPSAMGSSGSDHRHFEAVTLTAAGNSFTIAMLTTDENVDLANSFVRVAFRPAHDVAPSNGLATSALNPNGTSTLLTGLFLRDLSVAMSPNGPNLGLPDLPYVTMWQQGGFMFSGAPRGSSLHFELTVEVCVTYSDGSDPCYFVVDPEVIIEY